jgi:hypothetical protein
MSLKTKVFAKIRIIKRCNRVSFDYYQGDQMSLWRNRPKCRPANVLPKLIHNFYHEKSSPKIGASTVILIKLPKVIYILPNRRKFAQSGHPNVHTTQIWGDRLQAVKSSKNPFQIFPPKSGVSVEVTQTFSRKETGRTKKKFLKKNWEKKFTTVRSDANRVCLPYICTLTAEANTDLTFSSRAPSSGQY